jgi:alpha-galactosidase
VERFVLDDGWFAGRDDDRTSLGDWWVDARKYPDGLKPLADHVRGLGMEFGLWVEPEMVSPNSELFRAHPDWALQLAGRPLATARNQLVLDLTRPDVVDHLFDRLSALVAELGVAYLKWDHNRDLAPAGDAAGRAAYTAQVRSTWALMARLRSAFPDLEIESCAGGGGRIDAGIAAHVNRFWASDCIDARLRIGLQRGFQQFLPPEVMGAHIGAERCHTTGRRFSLAFQALVACQGHLGLEFDLTKLDPAERAKLAGWIGFYKQHRHLLHGGAVWTGTAGDGVAWHAAGSAEECLLLVYRSEVMEQRHAAPLRLPFLGEGDYRVAEVRPGERRAETRYSGAWLAMSGLPIPPGLPDTATAWHISRA